MLDFHTQVIEVLLDLRDPLELDLEFLIDPVDVRLDLTGEIFTQCRRATDRATDAGRAGPPTLASRTRGSRLSGRPPGAILASWSRRARRTGRTLDPLQTA